MTEAAAEAGACPGGRSGTSAETLSGSAAALRTRVADFLGRVRAPERAFHAGGVRAPPGLHDGHLPSC